MPDRALVRLVVAGELDIASVPVLDAELRNLRHVGFDQIALDVRRVDFIETHGVRLLGRWLELAKLDGFELRLEVSSHGPVASLLAMTGLSA